MKGKTANWLAAFTFAVVFLFGSLLALATVNIAPNGINMTSNITNGSTFTVAPVLNVSTYYFNITGQTVNNCTVLYRNTTATTVQNMTNDTNSVSTFRATLIGGSGTNGWTNLTYWCYDDSGNTTWLNTTPTAGFLQYRLDAVNPTLTGDNASVISGGGAVNVTWNTTTDFLANCSVKIGYYGGGGTVTYKASATTSGNTSFCNFTVSTTKLGNDGTFYIEKHVDSIGGRTAASGNYGNQTGISYRLPANQWVLTETVPYKNEVLKEVCARVPNATYVSLYNNTVGYHNYTTNKCGTTTNENTTAIGGTGLYVTTSISGTGYILNFTAYTASAAYIGANSSITESPWNIVGIYNWNGRLLSSVCALNTNITYASYVDTASNYYYTHRCGWDLYNTTAPAGSAVWVKFYNTTWILGGVPNVTISP